MVGDCRRGGRSGQRSEQHARCCENVQHVVQQLHGLSLQQGGMDWRSIYSRGWFVTRRNLPKLPRLPGQRNRCQRFGRPERANGPRTGAGRQPKPNRNVTVIGLSRPVARTLSAQLENQTSRGIGAQISAILQTAWSSWIIRALYKDFMMNCDKDIRPKLHRIEKRAIVAWMQTKRTDSYSFINSLIFNPFRHTYIMISCMSYYPIWVSLFKFSPFVFPSSCYEPREWRDESSVEAYQPFLGPNSSTRISCRIVTRQLYRFVPDGSVKSERHRWGETNGAEMVGKGWISLSITTRSKLSRLCYFCTSYRPKLKWLLFLHILETVT